jgi:hypothetical protein
MGIDTQRMFATRLGHRGRLRPRGRRAPVGPQCPRGAVRCPAPVQGGKAHLPRGLACCPHAMMVGSD